jgi:hypothetical protein
MLKPYDSRLLGDLVTDTGQRVQPYALLADPNLQAALDDAAGMIDAAVFVNNRYASVDLAGLTGQDLAFLLRLNSDLALILLMQRRGSDAVSKLPQYSWCMEWLQYPQRR